MMRGCVEVDASRQEVKYVSVDGERRGGEKMCVFGAGVGSSIIHYVYLQHTYIPR